MFVHNEALAKSLGDLVAAAFVANCAHKECKPAVAVQAALGEGWRSRLVGKPPNKRVDKNMDDVPAVGTYDFRSIDVDPEVQSRLSALEIAIEAQVRASMDGVSRHSSHGIIGVDAHVMATAAKHQFKVRCDQMIPSSVRRDQRGKRTSFKKRGDFIAHGESVGEADISKEIDTSALFDTEEGNEEENDAEQKGEAFDGLDKNPVAGKDELETKKKWIQGIVNPIFDGDADKKEACSKLACSLFEDICINCGCHRGEHHHD